MNLLRVIPAIVFVTVLTASITAQSIEVNRNNKTISITTTDEATAPADIAALTIGFDIYGPDSNSVAAEGGKISHAILEALKIAGVDAKAIESDSQGIERNRNFGDKPNKDEQYTMPYELHQSWIVSVSPDVVAKVLNLAVAQGANKSGAIAWHLSDHKALQAKAAENALVKARAVAEHMAGGLHVKLGELIYASNEAPLAKLFHVPAPGAAMYEDFGQKKSQANIPSLEIRPQIIREEATVYAVFAIE